MRHPVEKTIGFETPEEARDGCRAIEACFEHAAMTGKPELAKAATDAWRRIQRIGVMNGNQREYEQAATKILMIGIDSAVKNLKTMEQLTGLLVNIHPTDSLVEEARKGVQATLSKFKALADGGLKLTSMHEKNRDAFLNRLQETDAQAVVEGAEAFLRGEQK